MKHNKAATKEEAQAAMRLFHEAMAAAGLASVAVPKPVTMEWLAQAEACGMVGKSSLRDGAYYHGRCRNAQVARWDAAQNVFLYMRNKFGSTFAEDICHPADDNGFDLFVPVTEVEPGDLEKITED